MCKNAVDFYFMLPAFAPPISKVLFMRIYTEFVAINHDLKFENHCDAVSFFSSTILWDDRCVRSHLSKETEKSGRIVTLSFELPFDSCEGNLWCLYIYFRFLIPSKDVCSKGLFLPENRVVLQLLLKFYSGRDIYDFNIWLLPNSIFSCLQYHCWGRIKFHEGIHFISTRQVFGAVFFFCVQ